MPKKRILVTGATGYVGGRLVPRLLKEGYFVRAAGRSITKLRNRPWASDPNVELVCMDVFDTNSIVEALAGCHIAYYLIHSMNPEQKNFIEADKLAAKDFLEASQSVNLERIIYLSGLGEETPNLSPHLRSRSEVGHILQSGNIPVTVLRAAMIIGSGSASFEILRYLVDRLPIMVTPRWVYTKTQPIAIANVLNYLISCLESPETIGKIFDIGGPDVLDYADLMKIYAEEAQLPIRFVLPVPVFTPNLSSYWIHFVTPVHSSIARPLAEGLKNPTVCQENQIESIIPQELLDCRQSIRRALERLRNNQVETHWTDAGALPDSAYVYPGDPDWSGGTVYTDSRKILIDCSTQALWEPIIKIGGETGWYYGNWLWSLRGILDLLFGGVGLRGGRRDPNTLKPGDALDFWRVTHVKPSQQLRLKAEMKVPGEAFLTFELGKEEENKTRLTQTATFVPRGLIGILYWYLVTPLHHFIFNGMLKGIANASNKKILRGPEMV